MKQSFRAKRMAEHHKRLTRAPKLNLVSLMDIFTILVFFLLVNSSDVEVLQNDKTIVLPESISEQRPDTTLIVRVNATAILVGNRSVAQVSEVLAGDENSIASLAKELEYQASRAKPLTDDQQKSGRAVTIMGDQAVPYALLKKIMSTCAAADYRNISLAVTKIERGFAPMVEGQSPVVES